MWARKGYARAHKLVGGDQMRKIRMMHSELGEKDAR